MNNGFGILPLRDQRNLPDWIRLLPLGRVDLGDGREGFEVDAAALDTVVANFKSRGLDLVIDYEHQSLSGGQAPAAGWIKELEGRDDGLWGRVEWTPQAREYLTNKEYRYFSPVLRVDTDSRRPLALLHVGLTNVPAINNLPPLVAKAEAFGDARAAQAARAKKYDIGIKEGGHLTKPGEWAAVPDEQFADPVNYRYPMPDREQCRAAWSYWSQAKNRAQYDPKEQAVIEQRIKSRAQAVGEKIREEQIMKMQLMKLLGLSGEHPDEEIIALTDARIKLAGALPEIARVLALKEGAGPAEIIGAVKGLLAGADRLGQVETELAALKAEVSQGKAEKAVEAALAALKITPAQRDWALKYAQEKPKEFEAFVAAAPVVGPPTENLQNGKGKGGGGLTPEETALCKMMGVEAAAFKAEKTRLAEGQAQ
jgi:phage I-like protein